MLNGKVVSYSNTKDKIFNFVYVLSMREAVRQGAYSGERIWLVKVSCAKKATQDYIDRILFGAPFANQKDHDDFFLDTAKKICGCVKVSELKPAGTSDFTFGNAQKLINMVVKHFYVIYYYCNGIRDRFKYCHCPMDSNMLKIVWDDFNSRDISNVLSGYTKTKFNGSWSKEDFDKCSGGIPERYRKYQEYIRKVCEQVGAIPIEYDYYMWGEEDIKSELEE